MSLTNVERVEEGRWRLEIMPAEEPEARVKEVGLLSRLRRFYGRLPACDAFWAGFTRRWRWPIVVVLVGSLALAPLAPALLDRTSNAIQLVKGSPSEAAYRRMERRFPSAVSVGSMVVLVEARGGRTLAELRGPWCAFEAALARDVEKNYGCGGDGDGGDCFLRGAPESWCLLTAVNATYVAGNLVDAPTATGGLGGSAAATFVINYEQSNDGSPKSATTDLVNYVTNKAAALASEHLGGGVARVGVTGWDCFTVASTAGAQKDLEAVDTRSLPLALLVMALTLGSFPMLLIPVLNMACTTVLEFVVMAQIAKRMQIAAFAPSVMMTLTLAMSFDYSLFVCSRYLEARRDGKRDEARRVLDVVRGAGHTILVSGSTLVACFLGLLCFPSALLRGIGVSVSVGISTAMFMNLTLSPALLHVCGEGLVASQERALERLKAAFVSSSQSRRPSETGPAALEAPLIDGAPDDDDDLDRGSYDGRSAASGTTVVGDRGNAWRRLGAAIWDDRRLAALVVCAVVGVAFPFSRFALRVKTGADPVMTAPSPSPPQRTLLRLGDAFGAGAVAPYAVLFEGGSFASDADLDAADAFLYSTLADLGMDVKIVSPTRLGDDRRVYAADYARCRGELPPTTAECVSLLGLAQSAVAADGAAFTATVLLKASPYSPAGFAWLEAARAAAKDFRGPPGGGFVRASVYGFAGGLKDVIDELYGNFPSVIAITLGVVFALLTAAFRSPAVAVRSVCALCLTLSFAFGATVLVYQRSDGATLPAFLTTRSAAPTVSWLAPLLCFTIVVGLALDYDVFLLARVHEYRFREAMDDRSATLEAIEKTGVIISSAGLIMAIAFAGLLLSHTTILNQAAFILGVSVLFDTFLVRTFLTPALLSLSRHRAWWPSKPPPGLPRDDARALALDDDDADAASEMIQ